MTKYSTITSNSLSKHRKSQNLYSVGFKIGILGGGQLAQMLILKGHELGLEMYCLSSSKSDPAAKVCKNHFAGSPESPKDLEAFFKQVDIITFESEFYSAELLKLVSEKTTTQIFPQPEIIEKLRDRFFQKKFLIENKLPTSKFKTYTRWPSYTELLKDFPKNFVFKKRLGGYDGNGTFIIKTKQNYQDFISKHQKPEIFICEEFIPFKSEKAILFVRNLNNELTHFPLVQSQQKNQRCDWVIGPSKHSKEKALHLKIKKALAQINYVGIIAFELFDTGKDLLINEIAPRVHNTGHYSQQACHQDQFCLHLLAIMNQKLKKPELNAKAFVMTNLIGESNNKPELPSDLDGQLHWYGKAENRPGRKMGHINYIGNNQKQLLQKALKERKRIKL